MVDLSTIENEAEQAIVIAETVLPNLFSLPSWALPALQAAMKGIQLVMQSSPTGTSAATAASQVVDHLTPGAPAAPALQ